MFLKAILVNDDRRNKNPRRTVMVIVNAVAISFGTVIPKTDNKLSTGAAVKSVND